MGDSIERAFWEKYERIFEKTNPRWGEVYLIFKWLKDESKYAKFFEDIENLDELRRVVEAHFSQFKTLRKKVEKESRNVNRELKKRYEELRQKSERIGAKIPFLGAEKEEEKVPPPK